MDIDNSYHIETAEGIDIKLVPASIGVRSMAFTIDLFIRFVIIAFASIVLQLVGDLGLGLLLIIIFFTEWFYPVIFEITKGATPGKRRFNLIVVYDNGLPVTLRGSLLRNLFRGVDILPFGYVVGAIAMLTSSASKRLGDVVAGTLVVFKDEVENFSILGVQLEQAIQLPPLTTEQQLAVIAFAERAPTFSEARQFELANYLYDITQEHDKAGVEKLKAIASQLVGRT